MSSEGQVAAVEEQRQPHADRMPRNFHPEITIRTTTRPTDNNNSNHYNEHSATKRVPPVSPYAGYNGMPPSASSFGYPPHHMYHAAPPKHPPHHRGIPRHLRSVVTTSFSVEDEREHGGSREAPPMRPVEQRYEVEERLTEREDRDEWDASSERICLGERHAHERSRGAAAASSLHGPPAVQRTYSSPAYINSADSLKRSFYHHSQPADQYAGGGLPADFMPPKRMKHTAVTPPKQDKVLLPRSMSDVRHQEWSYAGPPPPPPSYYDREGQAYLTIPRPPSFPPPPPPPSAAWNRTRHQPPSPMTMHGASPRAGEYAQVSPASEAEAASRHWQQQPSPSHQLKHQHHYPQPPHHPQHGHWVTPSAHHPSHAPPHSAARFWESPRNQEIDHRQFSRPESEPREKHASGTVAYMSTPDRGDRRMKLVVDAVAATEAADHTKTATVTCGAAAGSTGKDFLLLALPDDRVTLSETLCVVRENIEVFTATQQDVDAPAPGRKHAVAVGQVGLRCIHCRHTTRGSERVKRAVCYPSSIKRIYRTVIDMKLDHFSQCKFVPHGLKSHLAELKAVHTRSTGTTMQYFIQAANRMGMTDGPSGVRLGKSNDSKATLLRMDSNVSTKKEDAKVDARPPAVARSDSLSTSSASNASSANGAAGPLSHRSDSMMSTDSFESNQSGQSASACIMPDKIYEGMIPLAMADDKTALSPLRCFLRSQVCAFSATKQDISVRAPTTFSISEGQVGIGCIHCVKQPAKLRSNRAVCFPFSIGRIYQSVADIQRFHLGECKMLPPDVKQQFLDLQSASSKGSKGLATRQYWVTSARKIGLTDTPKGIRFGRDPSQPAANSAVSLDILAQVAFSVTTASKKLVLSEDKDNIADFLYVVMEQLQPCRFTEADRNKRRLKDVGCIGVECKHCAGQVDSRKFFWSSVNAVESNFVSVHTHMLECRMVPSALKEQLTELKQLRKEQTTAPKTGSQKAFFARVWDRLHEEEGSKHAAAPYRRTSCGSYAESSGSTDSRDEDTPLTSV